MRPPQLLHPGRRGNRTNWNCYLFKGAAGSEKSSLLTGWGAVYFSFGKFKKGKIARQSRRQKRRINEEESVECNPDNQSGLDSAERSHTDSVLSKMRKKQQKRQLFGF